MLADEIKKLVKAIPADLKEKKGLYSIEFTVAERKVFLSKKKLTYSAKFRVDEEKKELRFTEMLKEAASGMSSGDSEFGSGFGFKKETFRTGAGPREGTINEQSELFGKQYTYKYDFSKVRTSIESEAVRAGYAFKYQVPPIGLQRLQASATGRSASQAGVRELEKAQCSSCAFSFCAPSPSGGVFCSPTSLPAGLSRPSIS